MSRHGYSDDFDDYLSYGRYRGQITSALRGRRGQRFLRELINVLDAMPVKRLFAIDYDQDGLYQKVDDEHRNDLDLCRPCALGAIANARGWEDRMDLNASEHHVIASRLDIHENLVAEVQFKNDEGWHGIMSEESRWQFMRDWAVSNLKTDLKK